MRKIVVFNLVSLDGYYAGPKGELDWHNTDEEFSKFAIEQAKKFKTLIFGRITYEMMKSYWSTRDAIKNDPIVANALNTLPKIVFSRTLKKVEEEPNWKNITLFNKIDPNKIKKLKQTPGDDITILGSGQIVQAFTNLGLVDEYRLLVNPVILGKGKSMFENVKNKLNLKFLETRSFKNGNVLLYYQV
ncbi:hypothetical protein A3A74_07085 [Candidatus Roizmanbacteria bacterium RIFCSPLOWO2_01_FULL_35_13]|uniref:Bacterial bifunctional deaminase-reductase C-terminal domain-containing protein n=1 Tax=Candidatus Roizmanbacteria bacterium RIFCSPLOWO2_01_FULL_35_13 TaxID=1802055 RepID=A0A1F7IA91_9BACT|nr:MAG: hypothetical protein A3A74_07085 [Candidatus Roizmanbacteria bacterium RIFCSPLOWO2_01_FULL_35_13]